jgi:hypothetical protein
MSKTCPTKQPFPHDPGLPPQVRGAIPGSGSRRRKRQSQPLKQAPYYVVRAIEADRLARLALSDENQQILLALAARWRAIAKTLTSSPRKGRKNTGSE